ncbi:MAG: hypothetical protein OXI54_08345 [Chloroflexota bacterium]|nr:hypothetical protein [Chloroflexota bacterium]
MVKQTRILFDPGDIEQMRLCCGHCGGDASYPFSQTFKVPARCPHCLADWWDDRPGMKLTEAEAHAINLARAIHYFLNPRNCEALKTVGFGIQLEINDEQTPDPPQTP